MLNDQNYQNNNVEDGDLDENGEKQNICRWIDCNPCLLVFVVAVVAVPYLA
jgi:hypothetical protein